MENLGFGLMMTVLGMGIVFTVLVLVWGLLTLLTYFDRPEPATAAEVALAPAVAPTGEGQLTPDEVAAIAVAVAVHTATLRREAAPTVRSYWPGSLLFASRWVAAGRARQNQSWQRRR
ncbi:OadG family protein [uncultured Chloroflexus sp.]|uniref:OadG family protein n=1 Tax=uncultured Chloroflexus sp. TaxID=214040 RepID=UPI0026383E73|nr:OadG family protein [uncultured Chloroflexus sp.]